MRHHERMVMLSSSTGCEDHLLSMDTERGINLRGYAQRDPWWEYSASPSDLFEAMMLKFQEDTVRFLSGCRYWGRMVNPWTRLRDRVALVPKAPPVASAPQPITGDGAPPRDRDFYAQTLDDHRRA